MNKGKNERQACSWLKATFFMSRIKSVWGIQSPALGSLLNSQWACSILTISNNRVWKTSRQLRVVFVSGQRELTSVHACRHAGSRLSHLRKKYSKWRDASVKDFVVAVCTGVVRKPSEAEVSISSWSILLYHILLWDYIHILLFYWWLKGHLFCF